MMKKQILRQAVCQLKKSKPDGLTRSKASVAAAAEKLDNNGNVKMPNTFFQPQPYKGPSYDEVQQIRRNHVNPGVVPYYKKPLLINQAHMQWIYDSEGKRYLDLIGSVSSVSVGHNHPRMVKALKKQLEKLWISNIHMHPKMAEYVKKLTDKLPDPLKVVYLVNSGSEANDLAMLMARLHTKNFDIVSLRHAYHGASPYLMNLTSLGNWRYNVPLGAGVLQAMNPDPYRGVWGGANCRDSVSQTYRKCNCNAGECAATGHYIKELDDTLKNCTPKDGAIAGMFIEGIQGAGGISQFTKGYVKQAFEMVRQRGGVCIHDEVQTGFGRTGEHFWGFEMNEVLPDIITMAKSIGNGFPLAAVVTTPEIAATLTKAAHFNTFGGTPLACTAGAEVLDIIEEEGLQKRCHEIGSYFIKELSNLKDECEIIGDVRGKGLMIGVELVNDKSTHTPLAAEHVNNIWETLKDNRIVLGKGGRSLNVLRVQPPMCITSEDVDFTVETLRNVLNEYAQNNMS